jgi:hypothetical protein
MIQFRNADKGVYTEWTDQGDTIKKETRLANSRYIQEFENGEVKRKYTRNQNGINGEFLERVQDMWIVHTYNNGIRTIEILPIAISYPNADEEFKKINLPYLEENTLSLPLKHYNDLNNKDKNFIVAHCKKFNEFLQSHHLKREDLAIGFGRSENWTILEIKTFMGSPVNIVFYDNDYYEFLNRTSNWSAIPTWQEGASFKWN